MSTSMLLSKLRSDDKVGPYYIEMRKLFDETQGCVLQAI